MIHHGSQPSFPHYPNQAYDDLELLTPYPNQQLYHLQQDPVVEHYYQPYPYLHQHYLQYPYPPITMDQLTQDEMEQFQRLSDQYQADLPGPLIGDKLPMVDLVQEYTAADPTYVVKTQTLAATHSGYRRVKGDGQCGWRGAVFGYFETLLKLGDMQTVLMEEVRLRSYADTMRMAGIDYDIIVDMFDYTWDLFADLKKAVEQQNLDERVLLEHMNDENRSNSIVYHFKMMTSAFLQNNPENYEPFLEMPIGDYRALRIDPTNQEIDQVGLQILTDGVIAQAGFAVDVLYLDRSIGDEVTPHQFATGEPTIRLLYRPGHYDIIYKDNLPQHGTEVQQSMLGQGIPIDYNSSTQANYQGNPVSSHASGSTYDAFGYPSQHTQSRQACILPDQPVYPMEAQMQQDMQAACYYQSIQSEHFIPEYTGPNEPPFTASEVTIPPATQPAKVDNEPKIRLVNSQFQYNCQKHACVPLGPPVFGSSAWQSTAHFSNREFQPLVWDAGIEYGRG